MFDYDDTTRIITSKFLKTVRYESGMPPNKLDDNLVVVSIDNQTK